MENIKRVTNLPANSPSEIQEEQPPNPARAVQSFVGEVMSVASKPVDLANLGVAKLTEGLANALPSFPAARLYCDLVLGWPHSHPHPPTFGFPLPSIGPVICAGATNVLINGLPAARTGDVGFGAWCGGYFPLFEVFTGSSNVFIGGARPARQFVDFTKHCLPSVPAAKGLKGLKALKAAYKNVSKLDKAMMGFTGAMGALQMGAALIDQGNYEEQADSAESESDAKEAAAYAEAAGTEALMAGIQAAADIAAMALSIGMGKDPGVTPLNCWGNFLTGSQNVLIGGLPMPGWISILRGLGKLLKRSARKIQLRLPEGSRLRRNLCVITGHPVDVASGRVFTSQTDFELPGRIPIEFTRTYDTSAFEYQGPLGRGWMHPYDIHLWDDEGQEMVILRNEEGLQTGFERIAVGEKTFNPLEKLWLERIEEEVYLVRRKDGVRFRFEAVREPDSVIGIEGDLNGKSESTALRLSKIEDRNGNRIDLSYEGGRLISLKDNTGTRLNFAYITLDNGAERLAAVKLPLAEGSARTARLVNFTYDSAGRLVNATDRGLVPWRYAYDGHLLIRETNRNGLSFHFAYKGEGKEARCVHTWGDNGIYERWLDYDRENRMTVVEDSFGRKTKYYFNEQYLQVKIVDALGGTKNSSYGSNGELLRETDENGRETRYDYNAQFDCTVIYNPDGTMRRFEYTWDSLPEKLVDEMGAEFSREYDERGNMTATIDALGNRRVYRYNRFGDLERAVDPLGGETKFKWNERGQMSELTTPLRATTSYGYDERNRLLRINDPLGNATQYAYDALDRVAQVERPDGTKHHYAFDPEGNLTIFQDANGAETRFRYVDNNKLGERIDALGYTRRFVYDTEANLTEVRNERGETYRFVYDALDRVTGEIDFDGLRWNYDFDPAGQLIGRTDPGGRITRFVRNLRGQVIESRRPDGTAINFSYDLLGRLTKADAPASELVFMYDALGQIIRESQNGQDIEHEYDSLGRRIKRRSPSEQTVEFSFDADSQLSFLRTPTGSMNFAYDKAGRIIKRQMPGELEESFYYDRCGRMIEQSLDRPSRMLFLRGYKYDAEGNLIELSDSNRGRSSFAYDPVERLREVMQPERKVEQFIYDLTGNLLRRGEREFRYEQPDRMSRADGATLTYDEIGNLVEKRRGESVIRYGYDPDNRLIVVESKEGGRIEFAYDAFGRRIAKKTKDGEIRFLWDGDVLLGEQRGERSNEYIFEPGNYEPLCRFNKEGFETYHNDHLGTPQELTNESGEIVWSANYDVYGQIRQLRSNDVENPIRFQGQYEDLETGLCYNFYRYFDPDSGRYINKDPIGLWGGANHYSYTVNPVNWVDPLGLITWQDYERQVRDIYGGAPFAARQYQAIVDGQLVNGIADNVAVIGGKNVAVEAKYISSWDSSIRNPRGTIREKVFAIREQRKVIAQARKYSAAFDEVIYHSNSLEFIQHYSRKFAKLGLRNIRFAHTPC